MSSDPSHLPHNLEHILRLAEAIENAGWIPSDPPRRFLGNYAATFKLRRYAKSGSSSAFHAQGAVNMSSRFGKILATLTNTAAKRFGLSCAVVALLATAARGISHINQESMWRQAADQVSQARANEMGLGVEPMKLRILGNCEKKFGPDFYAKQDCMNSELYGGLGEIENAAHQKIEIEYFLAVAVTALLMAFTAWAAGWAALALFVPLCRNYWAWLRRG